MQFKYCFFSQIASNPVASCMKCSFSKVETFQEVRLQSFVHALCCQGNTADTVVLAMPLTYFIQFNKDAVCQLEA